MLRLSSYRCFSSSTSLLPSTKHLQSLLTPIRQGPGGRASSSRLQICVLGCTGFIGRYVVQQLGKEGHSLILPYRGEDADIQHLRTMGDLGQLSFPHVDLRVPMSVAEVLRDADVVIHLIGADVGTRNWSLKQVHTEATETIARACRASPRVQRLIHISAVGADKYKDEYFSTKLQAEQLAQKIFPWTSIIRLTQVYGTEDRFLNVIGILSGAPFGRYPLINKGQNQIQPIYVGDVARALALLIRDDAAPGRVYEFGGYSFSMHFFDSVRPSKYSMQEFVDLAHKFMMRPFRPIHTSTTLLRLLTISPLAIFRRPFFSPEQVQRLGLDLCTHPELPGLRDVGLLQPTHFEDVAVRFLRLYRRGVNELTEVYVPPKSAGL